MRRPPSPTRARRRRRSSQRARGETHYLLRHRHIEGWVWRIAAVAAAVALFSHSLVERPGISPSPWETAALLPLPWEMAALLPLPWRGDGVRVRHALKLSRPLDLSRTGASVRSSLRDPGRSR